MLLSGLSLQVDKSALKVDRFRQITLQGTIYKHQISEEILLTTGNSCGSILVVISFLRVCNVC